MSVCTDAMALMVPNTVLQGGGEERTRGERRRTVMVVSLHINIKASNNNTRHNRGNVIVQQIFSQLRVK